MKWLFGNTSYPILLCRLTVGIIFLSEGLQKFIRPDEAGPGRFEKIGFTHPAFWAYFAGGFEIICGALILLGLFTRIATIPLLVIMATAFITTKIPILIDKGFWPFMHEYRTDFTMTMLLILLLIYRQGKKSFDQKLSKN